MTLTKKKEKTFPKLVKELDKIFSVFIRQRDRGICYTCGRTPKDNNWRNSDAGHYIPRAHKQYRFDEKNVNAQCVHCNWTLEGNKDVYRNQLINFHGLPWVEMVEAECHKPFKFHPSEIKILIEYYKNKVENI